MLTAKEQEIDLGTLPFGKPKVFSYELTNKGTEQVHVTKISVGCHACTKAEMPNPVVKPGETALLNVIFTPGSTGINKKAVSLQYGKTVLKLKFKSIVNK